MAENTNTERDRAIMEGERNASLDSYSRVVYLTQAESRIYETAFTNGWNRRTSLPLPAAGQEPVARAPERSAWINPCDKSQDRYLPNIGEPVLFKHEGRVYTGKHTGGSFKADFPLGKHFDTWNCMWAYPSALDYAAPQPAVAAGREQTTEAALRKVLAAVQRYLPPDGPNANDTLSEIIEVVDPWPLGQLDKS